ncbi:MAG: DUF4298 domain-containing protein [Erysipelotrichaceae bacterium]|nr:DUF4298 domain-containing protein [Erysipelotrichaceae bacterium]
MNKNIKRIEEMEAYLEELTGINSELALKLEEVNEARDHMMKLFEYYGSPEWYEDRDLDLEGVKAGVLSEDLIYEQIMTLRENAFTMLETATDILKERI